MTETWSCHDGLTHIVVLYLEESTGIILFEDFQAVLHHPSGLTQLHGAVGDLITHHLTKRHKSDQLLIDVKLTVLGRVQGVRSEVF